MKKVIISLLLSILLVVTPILGVSGCVSPTFTVTFAKGDDYPDITVAQGYEDIPLVQTVTSYKELVEPLFVCSQATQDGWNVPLNKINKNITITPRWVERKFTITFEPGAHDAVLTSPVGSDRVETSSGANVEKPTYTRKGYTLDPTWGNFNFDEIREDTTVTAKWIANQYKIYLENSEQEDLIFEEDANVKQEDGGYYVDVLYDSKVTLPQPIAQGDELTSKSFAGWQIKGTFTGIGDDYIYKTDGNLTVEALWLSQQYVGLIFYENLSTTDSTYPTAYNHGDVIQLQDPTKVGFEFLGWTYPGQETPVKQLNYTIPTTTTGNLTLVANWQRKTYTIRLDEVPGEIGDRYIEVQYGEKIENLPTPTIEGYEFLHWQFSNGTKLSTDYVWDIDEDTYLQAVYVRIFTIKFVLKNTVITTYPAFKWVTGSIIPGSYEGAELIKSDTEEDTYLVKSVRENTVITFLPKVKSNDPECYHKGWLLNGVKNKAVTNGMKINIDNFADCYQTGEIKLVVNFGREHSGYY